MFHQHPQATQRHVAPEVGGELVGVARVVVGEVSLDGLGVLPKDV
ncbi:hypothetical protein [Streptomyces angustmyceticus]